MRRLLLVFSLLLTFTAAFAGKVSREQNDADIVRGHKMIAAKVAMLDSYLKSHNLVAAEAVATDINTLMRTGMVQGMARINLAPKDQKDGFNKMYLQMETTTYDYLMMLNAHDMSANGSKMLQKANDFLKLY